MAKYTIETLIPLNGTYHMTHKVSQADVEMANKYKAIIELSRTCYRVEPGDIVELTTEHGDYYADAHIEKWDETEKHWTVCKQTGIPFVRLNGIGNNIVCSAGGGPWTKVPYSLKFIGKRKKLFKNWGHCGSCADGAVAFEAEVSVWEYIHPEPLYGEYSAKEYVKHHISYCVDEQGNPKNGSIYRYFGSGLAFETAEDYAAWLKTFRGVEFKGCRPNNTVVFCYKRVEKPLSKKEYDALELPIDTRQRNGVIEVKVLYDDTLHTVTEYRCNDIEANPTGKYLKLYMLAMQK